MSFYIIEVGDGVTYGTKNTLFTYNLIGYIFQDRLDLDLDIETVSEIKYAKKYDYSEVFHIARSVAERTGAGVKVHELLHDIDGELFTRCVSLWTISR